MAWRGVEGRRGLVLDSVFEEDHGVSTSRLSGGCLGNYSR
jgi:hypothetical protein